MHGRSDRTDRRWCTAGTGGVAHSYLSLDTYPRVLTETLPSASMSDPSEAEPLAPSAAGSNGAEVSEGGEGDKDGDGKSGVDRLPEEAR